MLLKPVVPLSPVTVKDTVVELEQTGLLLS